MRIGQIETSLPVNIAECKATYARQNALVFSDALDKSLLGKLRALTLRTRFISNQIEGLGHREIESPPLAGTAITLLLSRAPLFRWLEQATGCGVITQVSGAVARTLPSHGDGLDWHDDLNTPKSSSRRLAITIALDDLHYDGGLFEIRKVGCTEPLFSFKHEKAGTVLIFKVSTELEHRVRPLVSGGPRLVYAGWFAG